MISAIVLAAGRSRRMGAQKLLLPLGNRPVIAHVVDELLDSPFDEVVVVVGHEGNAIREALAGRRVKFVINPEAEGEMLSSVRCGLRAVPEERSAVLVALGDQPGITADVARLLLRALPAAGRGIVVPTHGGKRGHPILFATDYRKEILTRYDDLGLRGLLQAHPQDVVEVEVATPGVLEDLNVPEDYKRMAARFSSI